MNSGSSAVYTGFWVDHGTGNFLTLTNRNAALMLSFLTIAVTFAGNRSWKIVRFIVYQFFSATQRSKGRDNGGTLKVQVILRNTSTAGSTFITLLERLWHHRSGYMRTNDREPSVESRRSRHSSNTSMTALISAAHFLAFIVAGLFTSRVFVGRTVVSKVIDSCGQWDPPENAGGNANFMWQSLRRNETQDADNYVRNCYPLGVSRGILECDRLFSRSLPYTLEHDTPCPFSSRLCSARPNGALTLDSGRISFRDLGINSKLANQIYVQRRSSCAVVPDAPFLNQTFPPNATEEEEIAREYVFLKDARTATGFIYNSENVSAAYTLRAYHLSFRKEAIVAPIRPQSHDHDPSIIFLRSTGILFTNTSDDPWFSVHTPTVKLSDGTQLFGMDNFLNIIACKESARFCSDISGSCSAWDGILSAVANLTSALPALAGTGIAVNSSDWHELRNIYTLVGLNLFYTAIPSSIQGRTGASALQLSRYLVEQTQTRLEAQQWKLELEYWFAMALARLQLDIFNTIEKPPGVNEAESENTWNTIHPGLKELCGRVKFHSPDHTTLSTTGIVIVLTFVIVLIIISFIDLYLSWLPWAWSKKLANEWENLENLKLLEELESWWAAIRQSNDPLQVQVTPK